MNKALLGFSMLLIFSISNSSLAQQHIANTDSQQAKYQLIAQDGEEDAVTIDEESGNSQSNDDSDSSSDSQEYGDD